MNMCTRLRRRGERNREREQEKWRHWVIKPLKEREYDKEGES
jgi:hypothetical protein